MCVRVMAQCSYCDTTIPCLGGQGSINNTHGIGDTYHCGNWFVDVEAKSSHCGGGCHASYLHQKVYFNGYVCVQAEIVLVSLSFCVNT